MKKRMIRVLALALCLTMALCLMPAASAAGGITRSRTYTPGQFTDVAESAWYAGSVKDAYELGLMKGSTDTTFNPGGTFTVAEALTIAARLHHLYNGGDGNIPSVGWGAWYQSAVEYCVANRIVERYEYSNYACTQPATRADMAKIIAAALPEEAWTQINSIYALPDVGREMSGSDAVLTLYRAGVLTGSDSYGTFKPYASITRGEVAAIAARCADPLLRKSVSLQSFTPVKLPANRELGTVSYGRLSYQDKETQLWGLVDIATGKVIVEPKYYYDLEFKGGLAVGTLGPESYIRGNLVHNNESYEIIDINGNVVLTVTKPEGAYTSLGKAEVSDGGHIVVADSSGSRIYNSKGTLLAGSDMGSYSFSYGTVGTNYFECGDYMVLKNNGLTVLSMANGVEINSYPTASFNDRDGELLFRIKDGEKYALGAFASGQVTPAVYDKIVILRELAIGIYGDRSCLLNSKGVVPGAELGKYDFTAFSLYDRISFPVTAGQGEDRTWALFGENGLIQVFDQLGPYNGIFRQVDRCHLILENGSQLKDAYVVNRYGELITQSGYIDQTGNTILRYHDDNGQKYVVTRDEGFRLDPEENCYWMGEENGKPIVWFGTDGKTDQSVYAVRYMPGMEGFYYDEIKYAAEGTYLCRFNTDWYLVHP